MSERTESGGSIVRLSVDDANRICSGQVLTSLATAVKELLENALDAGATVVDIRLREWGAEAIEVSDNGSGITTADFEALTRKSATNKIQAFDDIYSASSYGFRGEALASLCEMSGGVAIVTRTANDAVATRLEFDRAGRIVSRTTVARPIGTTVLVTDLFKPLPVRHREFLSGLRRHAARLHVVLQAYGLIANSVRLLVTNVVTGSSGSVGGSATGSQRGRGYDKTSASSANKSKTAWGAAAASTPATSQADEAGESGALFAGSSVGARQTVLSTAGRGSLRDAIAEVLTAKFLEGLDPFRCELSSALDEMETRPDDGMLKAIDDSIGTADGVEAHLGHDDSRRSSKRSAPATADGNRTQGAKKARHDDRDENVGNDDESLLGGVEVDVEDEGIAVAAATDVADADVSSSGTGVSTMWSVARGVTAAVAVPSVRSAVTAKRRPRGAATAMRAAQADQRTAAASATTSRTATAIENSQSVVSNVAKSETSTFTNRGAIVGFISKAGAGIGRSNNEKQFLFINGRPVDVPKVTKAINEVWRTYEMGHKPAFVLDLQLAHGTYDINVSPDKREAMLVFETDLLSTLKSALHRVWESQRRTFAVQSLPSTSIAVAVTAPRPTQRGTQLPPGASNLRDSSPAPPTQVALVLESRGHDASASKQDKVFNDFSDGDHQQQSYMGFMGETNVVHEEVMEPSNTSSVIEDPPAMHSWASLDLQLTSSTSTGDRAAIVLQHIVTPQVSAEPHAHSSVDTAGPQHSAAMTAAASSSSSDWTTLRDSDCAVHSDNIFESPTSSSHKSHNSALVASSSATSAALGPGHTRSNDTEGRVQSRKDVHDRGSCHGDDHECTTDVSFGFAGEHAIVVDDNRGNDTAVSTVHIPDDQGRRQAHRFSVDAEPDSGRGWVSSNVPPALRPVTTPERIRKQIECVDVDAMRAHYASVALATKARGQCTGGSTGDRTPPPTAAAAAAVAAILTVPGGLLSDDGWRGFRGTADGRGAYTVASNAVGPARTITDLPNGIAGTSPSVSTLADCAAVDSSDVGARAAVESTLSRVLHKAQFLDMACSRGVLGQFNKGFIISRLRSPATDTSAGMDDLYILDQHASDEKATFERLLATTVMHEQRLLVPRPLELSAGEELTLREHLSAFNANGFHFDFDEDAPPGRRARLAAVPFSKNTTFGDEDVRELCSLLADDTASAVGDDGNDGGGGGGDDSEGGARRAVSAVAVSGAAASTSIGTRPIPRLPKVITTIASRACRSSIMIGEALDRRRMRNVVGSLAGLVAPWNCPHGRPTLRHLVALNTMPAPLVAPGPDGAVFLQQAHGPIDDDGT